MLETLSTHLTPCSGCGAQLPPGRGREYGWQELPDLTFIPRYFENRWPNGTNLDAESFLELCGLLGHEWSQSIYDEALSNGWFEREARLALALKLPEYINRPDVAMSYFAWWTLLSDLNDEDHYLRDGEAVRRPDSPITGYRGAMCDWEDGYNLLWSDNPNQAWQSCPARDGLWVSQLRPEWLLASFSTPDGGKVWVHDSDEIDFIPARRRSR